MASRKDLPNVQPNEIEVNFVADVHLIQILGEQLIGSEKVGILELIKNAYDAGATECSVWIEKVPGLPDAPLSDSRIANLDGPVITVSDNGRGMDQKIVEEGWLRPASRIKTSVKERLKRERDESEKRGTRGEYSQLVKALKKEHGGRLPLGEKGVGRFATHRLGKHLILQTKVQGESFEWILNIDWNKFDAPDDKPVDLHTIPLTLKSQKPERDYTSTNSGTMIRIYGGREGFEWTDKTLTAVGHSIAQLNSPAKDKNSAGFKVIFYCPQLSESKFDVLTEIVPAPFRCIAIVDENGKADIEIHFTPPLTLKRSLAKQKWQDEKTDLRSHNPTYWRANEGKVAFRKPACGPFTVDIRCWLRTKEWIDVDDTDLVDYTELTDYLDEFGGIGVYRDGFSILPAQIASKDDALGLASRRIKRIDHLSYYQLWGSVDLIQENNLGLVDRTSREGMLETLAYKDLVELLRPIITTDLETRVKGIRERYNKLMQKDALTEATLAKRSRVAKDVIKAVAENYKFEKDTLGLKEVIGNAEYPNKALLEVADTIDDLRDEIREIKIQSNALLEAAGYGIAIAVAVHEIEKITSNLYFRLEKLSKTASGLSYEAHDQIDQLSQSAQSLLNELKRIGPLRVTRLEPRRKFKVRDSILAASAAFRLSWEELNISCILPPKASDFEIEGSFGACSQVFANLFDNATYWLQSVDKDARKILVQMDSDDRKVIVADTGLGIAEKIRPHLFTPFYSLKSPPSGLGLYICKYYMQQMKGTIKETSTQERLAGFGGAQFTVKFPKEKEDEK